MPRNVNDDIEGWNLTLTSVVFECCYRLACFDYPYYLTLTSVVFEYNDFDSSFTDDMNLTLTSVVFELNLTTDCIFT